MKKILIIVFALIYLCFPHRTEEFGRQTGQESFISNAVLIDDTLWALSDRGNLYRLDKQSGQTYLIKTPQRTIGICKHLNHLVIVASSGVQDQILHPYIRTFGLWRPTSAVRLSNEAYIGVECSSGISILTSKRYIENILKTPRSLSLKGEFPYGNATLLRKDYSLYVGLNGGEWGGGLHHIDLKTGLISAIQDTVSACDGLLNSKCDTVTSLSHIPWKPDCIAATVGLIHLGMRNGRVLEVCGNKISLLLETKLETFDLDGTPILEASRLDTEPFWGSYGLNGKLIIVGSRNIYFISPSKGIASSPLPQFESYGLFEAHFENKDYALVMSAINARHSVGSLVPILAPNN